MKFKYCPYCKSELDYSNYIYTCKNMHNVFINPSPCISLVPTQDNKILLSIRGVEPKKGTYDILGGFVKVGETFEEAGIREMKEETGLDIKIGKFIGQYTEEYTKDVTYPMIYAYFVEILGGDLKPQDDVGKLIWVDINNLKSIDLTKSFKTVKQTIDDALKIIS